MMANRRPCLALHGRLPWHLRLTLSRHLLAWHLLLALPVLLPLPLALPGHLCLALSWSLSRHLGLAALQALLRAFSANGNLSGASLLTLGQAERQNTVLEG